MPKALALLFVGVAGFAGGGGSPARAQTPTDVVEFPYVMYRSTVYAPDPRTHCAPDPKTERVYVPCEPDPYRDICHAIPRETIESALRYDARIGDIQKQSQQIHNRAAREAHDRLGPEPGPNDPAYAAYMKRFGDLARSLADGYWAPVRAGFERELERSRPKVESIVAMVRETMKRLIDSSPRFARERSLMKGFVDCAKTVRLDVDRSTTNARMASSFWADPRSDWAVLSATRNGHDVRLVSDRIGSEARPDDDDTEIINPLEVDGPGGGHGTCFLTLTPKAWLACADGELSCLRELFHEFGHLFNSCLYLGIARRGRVELRDHYAAADTEDMRRGATGLDFLVRESTAFAQKLEEATSCLAGLSDTHDGVPNSCPKDPEVNGEERARCDESGSATGYPPQWNEAEADFWGASGVALWLRENFRTQDERAAAFYRMFAYTCANDALEDRREHPGPHRSRDLPIEPLAHPTSCKDRPAGRLTAKPWGIANDPFGHEPFQERADRNFMRNSDLREALGCPTRDPRIPFTCSPVR